MVDGRIRESERIVGDKTGAPWGIAAGIGALADRVRGPVFVPGDDGYDPERAGFQTARRHTPDVVVGAAGPDDVRAAVGFAGARGLPVGVQGTGHALLSVASEGGVLVTTSRMGEVRIDAEARTAWIGAGARWTRVIGEAAPHGLAPLSGSFPGVGAVSYTLGGGLGLLSREYGYAADHVRAIEVVTADGRLRRVTAENDPDLFWALRGGRDNFGVVTGMEVDLFPVSRLYGGGLFFDGALAGDVLDAYLEWTETVPDAMSSSVALIPFPDLPQVPEAFRGRRVAQVRVSFTGDAAEGERLVAPLRAAGPRLEETLRDMPFAESGSIYNEPTAPHAYAADNAMLRDLDAPALREVLGLTGPNAPVPCVVQLRHLGGALSREPAFPNSVGHRNAKFLFSVLSPLDGSDPDDVRSVHGRVIGALASRTMGRCLNYMYGERPTAERVRGAYDPEDYRRLTELKAVHDPANTFRSNHDETPLAMAIGQQAGAAAILLPFAAATVPGEAPARPVVASVLALALLSTAVAYLLYFRLIASVGPTATSTVSFLVPAFGVLFGVVLLGEPLGTGTLAGLATILFGVALTTGARLGFPTKNADPAR